MYHCGTPGIFDCFDNGGNGADIPIQNEHCIYIGRKTFVKAIIIFDSCNYRGCFNIINECFAHDSPFVFCSADIKKRKCVYYEQNSASCLIATFSRLIGLLLTCMNTVTYNCAMCNIEKDINIIIK